MPTARFARASAPAASCRCARSPVTPLSTARAHTQHRHRTHAAPMQHARCTHTAPKPHAQPARHSNVALTWRRASPAQQQSCTSTERAPQPRTAPSVSTAQAHAFAHSHAAAGTSTSASASPPRTPLHLPAQAWRARARSSGELHAAARRTTRTTAMLTRHAGICKSNLPNTAFALCMHAARRSPIRLCAFASPAAVAPPLHHQHPAQLPRQHKSRPQAQPQRWAAAGNPCTPRSSAGCH